MVGLPMTHAWPSPEVFLPRTEPRTVSCFTLWKHLLSVSLDCQFIQGRNHHPQNIGEKNCGYFYFPWAFCKVSHVNCWLIDWLNLSPIWTPGGDSTHRPRPHQWPFSFIFWQPSIQATNPQRPAHTPCLPKPSPEFTVVSKHLSLFQMDLFSYFYPFISLTHSLTKPGSGSQQRSVSEVMEGFDSKQRGKCQPLKLRSKYELKQNWWRAQSTGKNPVGWPHLFLCVCTAGEESEVLGLDQIIREYLVFFKWGHVPFAILCTLEWMNDWNSEGGAPEILLGLAALTELIVVSGRNGRAAVCPSCGANYFW